MRIRNYLQFIGEEISGTELIGPIGPAYGETRLQNKTINQTHTATVSTNSVNRNSKNSLTSGLYLQDDWNELYIQYLKLGGRVEDLTGDTRSDIETMSNFIEETDNNYI